MANLSNDQLLISSQGNVLDAGYLRLVPPLEGELAFAPEEVLAEFASKEGVALVEPGEGLELSAPELADHALVDINTGNVYATGVGWVVAEQPGDDVDLEDPQAAVNYASSSGTGAPGAPPGWEALKLPPGNASVVVYP